MSRPETTAETSDPFQAEDTINTQTPISYLDYILMDIDSIESLMEDGEREFADKRYAIEFKLFRIMETLKYDVFQKGSPQRLSNNIRGRLFGEEFRGSHHNPANQIRDGLVHYHHNVNEDDLKNFLTIDLPDIKLQVENAAGGTTVSRLDFTSHQFYRAMCARREPSSQENLINLSTYLNNIKDIARNTEGRDGDFSTELCGLQMNIMLVGELFGRLQKDKDPQWEAIKTQAGSPIKYFEKKRKDLSHSIDDNYASFKDFKEDILALKVLAVAVELSVNTSLSDKDRSILTDELKQFKQEYGDFKKQKQKQAGEIKAQKAREWAEFKEAHRETGQDTDANIGGWYATSSSIHNAPPSTKPEKKRDLSPSHNPQQIPKRQQMLSPASPLLVTVPGGRGENGTK